MMYDRAELPCEDRRTATWTGSAHVVDKGAHFNEELISRAQAWAAVLMTDWSRSKRCEATPARAELSRDRTRAGWHLCV